MYDLNVSRFDQVNKVLQGLEFNLLNENFDARNCSKTCELVLHGVLREAGIQKLPQRRMDKLLVASHVRQTVRSENGVGCLTENVKLRVMPACPSCDVGGSVGFIWDISVAAGR